MITQIVESEDDLQTDKFLKDFLVATGAAQNHLFKIYPENKEITIGQIRELRKRLIFETTQSEIYVIYNFDKASYEAQNAFLKTLEEHSDKVSFVLVVSNHRNLLPTVISRSKITLLQKSAFKSDDEIYKKLQKMSDNHQEVFFESGDNLTTLMQNMLEFYRARLASDPQAGEILKEIVKVRYQVLNNNLNHQLALDHLSISIQRTYSLTK